ncbi:flavin reductase family protein [Cyanobium sp. ATX 6F1]|uniref:flavin reductase family protein n=1 Tax=Cyanobium sp. ATX 6F1 TaxID=2823702 RepID=UPI0020CC0812|nr:flavin reductase family protein [Cyanobium sp. ATX 6F1]
MPRPIAWVSSISGEGQPNLAPFSFFNAVSDQPAVLMVSIGARPDREKDTLRNIRQTRCFAVHGVDERLAGAMNITATDFPPGSNEFEAAGLIAVPGTTFTMALGQVVMVHVQERCLGDVFELVRPRLGLPHSGDAQRDGQRRS